MKKVIYLGGISLTNNTNNVEEKIRLIDLLMIAIGCAAYAFALVTFNIANQLAEGGITGVTLILKGLFNFNPAYSTILINIPLILFGYRLLGRRTIIYTLYGTLMLSAFLWIWQRVPLSIDLHHDLFLAAMAAGITGGAGSGLLYRFGGTTGGTDVIARIFERFRGIPMGQTLLWLDVLVLFISLIYIDIRHMAYTLLYSYVFSRLVNFILSGTYAAKGVLIVSSKSQEIVDQVMTVLQRGVSILHGEGGYSHKDRPMLYVVVSPSELHDLQMIVGELDKNAFMTIFDVNEAIGEGFTYARPSHNIFKHVG
ncbi:YitT family membrane protein [Secundilactobacillus pentosiphilus]|uniref:YitT family membrane protein n=1 Tax=Secundilactobacillus pentosiphilus TaxID=1714682 RepID=A0A1Z5IN82_9LACO|nr:YitT family membrane protein [Secundilactobacillus pentosiphilus]GAX05880.1 YitT family membrane protein [Secundilactobacillus pentosiphilus]